MGTHLRPFTRVTAGPFRALVVVTPIVLSACGLTAREVKPTIDRPPTAAEMAEFWVDADVRSRDLLYGVGGRPLAPDPDAHYTLLRKEHRGFSPKDEVRDPSGREWSVKSGPEAQTEVVASRIVWAMGYHQPPIYYLPSWLLANADGTVERQSEGRFRPKLPMLDAKGFWSWQRNTWVGTRPYRGLLVLMMMLNSTDLKNDNNAIYKLDRKWDGASRWFVVRDLGATFGETGRLYPRRNWIVGFEQAGFVTGIDDEGHVQFDFHGRHRELLRSIRPADVRWIAGRMARLTDAQWGAAFRAGGYTDALAQRFIAKLKEKIAQGRALGDPKGRPK